MLRIILFFSLIVFMIPLNGNCQMAAEEHLYGSTATIQAGHVLEIPDLPTGNQQFYHMIQPVIDQHERVQSALQAVEIARETIGIASGARYPNLQAIGEWGYRNEDKVNDNDDFSGSFNNLNLGIRQNLYDFGKTSASIAQSRVELIGQELNLKQTRLQFILDAATAYQNLHKAYMLLIFAREAEATAKDKVEREKGKVRVLGEESRLKELEYQLVETVSKRIRCQGDYKVAQNMWVEFFGALPDKIGALKPLDLSLNADLPQSIEQALEEARNNNLDIQIARNQYNSVALTLKQEKRKALYPDINLVMDGSFENNLRDATGKMDTYKAMVEFRKDINLGLADKHRIKAAERLVGKEKFEMADQLRIVETDTRNAWNQLETAKKYSETLAQQITLTAELLDMARREHNAGGNKTIMDVLAGETNLINARSASYAAQIDISLATLKLAASIDTLNLEMFAKELENNLPLLEYTRFLNSHLYNNERNQSSGISAFQFAYDGQSGYYELFNIGQRIPR